MKTTLCIFLLIKCIQLSICDIKFAKEDLYLTLDKGSQINTLEITNEDSTGKIIELIIDKEHKDLISVDPLKIKITKGDQNTPVNVKPLKAGHADVYANSSNWKELEDCYFRITINKIPVLDKISFVIGWSYFVIWSISFYPQVYINFKRKSVVGLNFDYLALNLLGFFLYGIYNVGLYYIPVIKDEYRALHPRGLNPVQLNDVFFAWHAFILSLVAVLQTCIYERGEQKVSYTSRLLMGVYAICLLVSGICSMYGFFNLNGLDFLTYCSYIKLSITLIKYVPQAYLNYKRKSTIGWSIGNIFCDFTGGVLSTLQMLLNAYNYDDWESIFGDLTKFGLGFFSIVFDIFFMIQHYILYRHSSYQENTDI